MALISALKRFNDMKLILSYPISKPFSPRYSTVIVFVFSLSLAAIVTWTFMTEKDCLFVTRDVYDNGICKPHNINNGDILRRTRDGGEEPISYHVSISGLSHEYPYVNNNFDCGAIVNFAIIGLLRLATLHLAISKMKPEQTLL
ncbi:hypothetical protein BGZ76_005525 [Entomortierella beljakovae]|nr:hypothetical protein BGZ76_005525 [Entomortierella beljakovae]